MAEPKKYVSVLQQVATDMIDSDEDFTTIFVLGYSGKNVYSCIHGNTEDLAKAIAVYSADAIEDDELVVASLRYGLEEGDAIRFSGYGLNVNSIDMLQSLIDRIQKLKDTLIASQEDGLNNTKNT